MPFERIARTLEAKGRIPFVSSYRLRLFVTFVTTYALPMALPLVISLHDGEADLNVVYGHGVALLSLYSMTATVAYDLIVEPRRSAAVVGFSLLTIFFLLIQLFLYSIMYQDEFMSDLVVTAGLTVASFILLWIAGGSLESVPAEGPSPERVVNEAMSRNEEIGR